MKTIINSFLLALLLFSGSIHAEYSITTKDGITIDNIPDDVPDDAQWIKEAVNEERARRKAASAAPVQGSPAGQGVYNQEESNAALADFVRKRAEEEEAEWQGLLGYMYFKGEGVPKDDVQAVHWFRKAAEQGDTSAQFALGVMYRMGTGVPKDDAQAVHWYQKAADQGNANAQFNLGVMYGMGTGVPRDDAQAVYWYRKAAEQGSADGQLKLGLAYDMGNGIPKDEETAYFWYLLSSAQGHENAVEFRDWIEKNLTLQQRANAQAAARVWKPKKKN